MRKLKNDIRKKIRLQNLKVDPILLANPIDERAKNLILSGEFDGLIRNKIREALAEMVFDCITQDLDKAIREQWVDILKARFFDSFREPPRAT